MNFIRASRRSFCCFAWVSQAARFARRAAAGPGFNCRSSRLLSVVAALGAVLGCAGACANATPPAIVAAQIAAGSNVEMRIWISGEAERQYELIVLYGSRRV